MEAEEEESDQWDALNAEVEHELGVEELPGRGVARDVVSNNAELPEGCQSQGYQVNKL